MDIIIFHGSKILRSKGWQESKILKLFSEVQWLEFKEWSYFFNFSTEFSILSVRNEIPLCRDILTLNCFLVSPIYVAEHCSQEYR